MARLPDGVRQVVAGAACSLLLHTNPPSHARDDWDVTLVSYRDELQLSSTRDAHQRTGAPLFFALRASGGGVQSCSFVATHAGVVVCRARIRGRAMAPCTLSIKVVASEPSAAASSVCLVHPLPSIHVVTVGCKATLTLMVRARARCFSQLAMQDPSVTLEQIYNLPLCTIDAVTRAAAAAHMRFA